MTLRDVTKKNKTLVGRCSVAFACLTPVRSFPPLTRRVSLPFYLRDRGLRSRGISEHLPVIYWARAGSPGACHRRRSQPTTPNKLPHGPYQESRGGHPPTSKSPTGHSLSCDRVLQVIYITSRRFSFTCGIFFGLWRTHALFE